MCLTGFHAGFEPRELIGRPSLELVHPDEFAQVRGIHYSTITQDQAAVLAYLRMRHKDPCKGYILCAIVRDLVDDQRFATLMTTNPVTYCMPECTGGKCIIRPTGTESDAQRINSAASNDHNPDSQGL